MRLPPIQKWIAIILVACLSRTFPAFAAPSPGADASDAKGITGTWLPERALGWHKSELGEVRSSKLIITSNSFALSKFRDMPRDLTGTFSIDPGAYPKKIDLQTDPIDLTPSGSAIKYPPAAVPGIYKLEGDLLTVCIQTGSAPVRPARFEDDADGALLLVLRRADPDFKDYPKLVTLSVFDVEGKPVQYQSVFQFMNMLHDPHDPSAAFRVPYSLTSLTDASGKATVAYEDFAVAGVYDSGRKQIGFTTASPSLLQKGTAAIRLAPQCLLTGTIVCDELTKAGKPLGWTNVYLMKNGERFATCDSNSGHFRFLVAPGEYTLFAYGTFLHKKFVSVTVPAGVAEYQAPPIELNSSRLEALKGHPAPEPAGIVGWKGQPVKIADLRGKYVLVDFWGYWCGPCVGSMPVMIDLQEKYKGKGLAILSVHVDVDGDVGTAAELDEKIAGVKASLWGGRDLPFPTALSRGAPTPDGYDGITAAQFGVLGFPTTILIDRQGNVVGQFSQARDLAAAEGEIDRVLAANK